MNGRDRVRLAGVDDAGEVARLLHAFNMEFDDPTPGVPDLTTRCRRLLAQGDLTVVLVGAPPLGLAVLRFRPSLWTVAEGALDAHLEELYVVPERRREGRGRALLEAAMRTARERGAIRIDIATSTDDVGAIGLYESAGFTGREGEGGPLMLFYERDL